MPAFVLHDILCQCSKHHPREWPISRFQADKEFLREGLLHAPLRARLYYAGIRIGGGIHALITASAAAPYSLIIRRP
jgi:hypothetical protein